MNRKDELGASMIKTVIILLILFFAGLILFQYASSFFIKNNIYTEIHVRIGFLIGDSANMKEIQLSNKVLVNVLNEFVEMKKIKVSKKNFNASYVKLDQETGQVSFYYEYTLVLNLLITETTEEVSKHGTLQ